MGSSIIKIRGVRNCPPKMEELKMEEVKMEDSIVIKQIAELGYAHEIDKITDRNFVEMVKN